MASMTEWCEARDAMAAVLRHARSGDLATQAGPGASAAYRLLDAMYGLDGAVVPVVISERALGLLQRAASARPIDGMGQAANDRIRWAVRNVKRGL